MSEWWALLLAAGAGLVLGLFFFGGLWWTVRRLPTTRRPVLLLLVSFIVRMGLTLPGFYLVVRVAGGAWQPLLAAFVGFFVARLLLTRQLSSAKPAAERGEP